MEDVLSVYKRPYDPEHPVVCMDESSKQLIAEVRPPEGVAPGKVRRQEGLSRTGRKIGGRGGQMRGEFLQ